MKKILLLVLALAVSVMFSACGADDTKGNSSSNNQSGALMPDTSNNSSGGSLTSDIMPSMPDGSMVNPGTNTPAGSSSNGSGTADTNISRDKAIEIALNAAGVTKEKARDLDAELDRENGTDIWDVDFESGNMDYSYDINAKTGAIVKQDKQPND